MSGKHIASGELRAILHHLQQDILSIAAYERYIPQVDDQSAALQLLTSAGPGILQLGDPRRNKRSF